MVKLEIQMKLFQITILSGDINLVYSHKKNLSSDINPAKHLSPAQERLDKTSKISRTSSRSTVQGLHHAPEVTMTLILSLELQYLVSNGAPSCDCFHWTRRGALAVSNHTGIM